MIALRRTAAVALTRTRPLHQAADIAQKSTIAGANHSSQSATTSTGDDKSIKRHPEKGIGLCPHRKSNFTTVNENTHYNLVFLRHGQSTWNRDNRFIGWTDTPLVRKKKAGTSSSACIFIMIS